MVEPPETARFRNISWAVLREMPRAALAGAYLSQHAGRHNAPAYRGGHVLPHRLFDQFHFKK
jgi:hypothetical protein